MFLLDRPPVWSSWRKVGLAVAFVAALGAGVSVQAKPSAGLSQDTVDLVALPREAQTTHRLVLAGGPFPYDKDGVVFGNRERLLPAKTRGYYREYTVKTPGARNRGARRLVCGGTPPTKPDACYYTDDHYAGFKRIAPGNAQ